MAAVEGVGYGVVAVVDHPLEQIVGEADYFLLDNGELVITVAADWRGWLGPYLLDVLIEAAAARGVPNLEAEFLVERRAGGDGVSGPQAGRLANCPAL